MPASEPPVPKEKDGIVLMIEQQQNLIAAVDAPWSMNVFRELDAATKARGAAPPTKAPTLTATT